MNLAELSILNPQLKDGVLVLDLNHGRANEMGSDCLRAWEALSAQLEQGKVRAVITTSQRLSSKGKPIFISGADVTERRGWNSDRVKSHVRWQRQVLQRLRNAPVFHIAVVDGVAFGWGTEFMLCCDYRISTARSVFALPETSLGILPGAGGTSELWMEIGVAQALRLGMTCERIDGEEAKNIGLIQECTSDWASAMERAKELASLAALRSPTAIAAFKQALLSSRGREPQQRTELEAQAYEHCVSSGEAAIGRENFKSILAGEAVKWGPFSRTDG